MKKGKSKQIKNSSNQFGPNNYPLGDFLIRIKNASLVRQKDIQTRSTKLIKSLAKTLEKEGYLHEVNEKSGVLSAKIVYRKKEPLVTNVKLVSKPGLRIYMSLNELKKRRSPTTLILTTSKGVMTSKDAIKKGLGGEAIAEIL